MPSSGTTIADMYGRGCLAHGDCSAARGITDQHRGGITTLPSRAREPRPYHRCWRCCHARTSSHTSRVEPRMSPRTTQLHRHKRRARARSRADSPGSGTSRPAARYPAEHAAAAGDRRFDRRTIGAANDSAWPGGRFSAADAGGAAYRARLCRRHGHLAEPYDAARGACRAAWRTAPAGPCLLGTRRAASAGRCARGGMPAAKHGERSLLPQRRFAVRECRRHLWQLRDRCDTHRHGRAGRKPTAPWSNAPPSGYPAG